MENGNRPVGKVTKEILTLNNNDIYLLITPFLPGPLIDIVKGFDTYSINVAADEVHTFIKNNK